MPVYEYKCEACGREFEYQQRMSDPEKETCEVCAGKLERLISRTAFSLKGGGWYKDLYSSTKPDKPAGGGDKPAGEGAASTPAAAPSGGDGGGAASTPAAPAAAAPASSSPSPSSGGGTSGGGGSSGGGST